MKVASPKRWAVVGGGFLGMTLALRLAQAGHRVTLFEAAPALGGLAGAWQVGELTWDRHYHVTLLSDGVLRALLDELGIGEDMEWVETRTGCYAGGRLHSVSNSLELLRFPALSFTDKLRLGLTMAYGSRVRDWRALERIPVEDWLVRLSGRQAFQRFWLPLLRSKLGDSYRETSAAFMWATIARLYAARRTGLKKEMFGYVRGGYARILARFAQVLVAAGVRLELGRPVAEVARAGGELVLRDRAGAREGFQRAVVTTAAPLARELCPQLSADERARLAGIRYLGITCASLVLNQPLAGFYLTNILDDGFPFTGVVETSAFVKRDQAFGGKTLVYLPRYLPPGDPFSHLSDQEVETQFVAGLRRMFPQLGGDAVEAFRVSRVRWVAALSTLGYSERLPPMRSSVPGLWLVSSAHIANGTLNVNETVGLAERVAPRLRNA